MKENNLQRMIMLADEFFNVKNDPSQLSVNEETIAKLQRIHPNTLNEKRTKDGPVAWVLLLPTSADLMNEFIQNKITEQELLDQTPVGAKYKSLYLCSVLVLPEYRGKGLAKQLILKGINSIKKDHQIASLFCWLFSDEGTKLAGSVAKECRLPLHFRKSD